MRPDWVDVSMVRADCRRSEEPALCEGAVLFVIGEQETLYSLVRVLLEAR